MKVGDGLWFWNSNTHTYEAHVITGESQQNLLMGEAHYVSTFWVGRNGIGQGGYFSQLRVAKKTLRPTTRCFSHLSQGMSLAEMEDHRSKTRGF